MARNAKLKKILTFASWKRGQEVKCWRVTAQSAVSTVMRRQFECWGYTSDTVTGKHTFVGPVRRHRQTLDRQLNLWQHSRTNRHLNIAPSRAPAYWHIWRTAWNGGGTENPFKDETLGKISSKKEPASIKSTKSVTYPWLFHENQQTFLCKTWYGYWISTINSYDKLSRVDGCECKRQKATTSFLVCDERCQPSFNRSARQPLFIKKKTGTHRRDVIQLFLDVTRFNCYYLWTVFVVVWQPTRFLICISTLRFQRTPAKLILASYRTLRQTRHSQAAVTRSHNIMPSSNS